MEEYIKNPSQAFFVCIFNNYCFIISDEVESVKTKTINNKNSMNRKLMYAFMAFAAMSALSSCEDEDLAKVYDEETSLDSPFIFSEGYQDSIAYVYDLPTPATDWLGMVKDETKVCKLSIPGTHDTMTGMGFYQPVLKYVFNMTAISQVSTLEEQMNTGLRFFDIRPVVSTDTIAKKKILRLTHGISELDITFEWTIDQLQSFLKAHPTEFFIAKLQFDNGFEDQKDLFSLLSDVLHKSKYQGLFFENWRPDITVGEMRGYITNASNLHPLVVADLLSNEGTVGIIPMDMACHDYVHCIVNGGTPYTSDYLYGFYPMSLSLTNLLIKSNKPHFK